MNIAGTTGAGKISLALPMFNKLQNSIVSKLTEAGVNPVIANSAAQALMLTTATAVGTVAGGGSAQGAAAGLNVDANNRLLHQSEKDLIARKADGDKAAAERLTKAACFEIRCWAQFPEGSPLYNTNYVSPVEAAGLKQEIAWINQQKISGEFIYTPFQKLTDGVAATTGLSSVNGQGTFNGQLISKPSSPFMGNDCVTAECAAGMAPFRGNSPPDYVSAQGNFYIASGGFSVNLHNGETFGQWGMGRSFPGYSITPGFSVNAGTLVGGGTAQSTSDFLKGGGMQANAYVPPIPAVPILNVGGGVNHSYGGRTSMEIGISTQPGASVTPIGYGFATGEKPGAGK